MSFIDAIFSEILSQATRAVTGRLFTNEQIKRITSNSVGKHLSEFFPEDQNDISSRKRVDLAQEHINKATAIMTDMSLELHSQKTLLEELIKEIDEKKSTAIKYAELAKTNQQTAAAVRQEIEKTIREELTRQSNAGSGVRRTASILLWSTTLILGAALGSYFRDIVDFVSKHFNIFFS